MNPAFPRKLSPAPGWIPVFFLAAFFSACQTDGPSEKFGPDPLHLLPSDNCPGISPELRGQYDALYANWHKWNSREPGSYSFSFSQLCECSAWNGSVIHVAGDTVAGTEPRTPGGQPWPMDQAPTMDSLFFAVGEALCQNPDSLSVEYDPEFGFPAVFYVDREAMAIDDEVRAEVTGFSTP